MIPGLSITKLLLGTTLLVGAGIGAVSLFSSDLPSATPLEDLPDLVHSRVCDRIARELPEPTGDGRLILPPITDDRNEAIRTRLARSIDRTGRYDVVLAERPQPDGWLESEVLPQLADWLDEIPGFSSAADRPGWLLDAQVGPRPRQDDEEALDLSVEWRLRNLKDEGRPVAAGTAEERIERSLGDADYLRFRIGETSVWVRGFLWAAILLLPWLLAKALFVEVLRKESNSWNAALWALAAAPGAIAGYILTAFAAGWGGSVMAILAGAATLVLAYGYLNLLEAARR